MKLPFFKVGLLTFLTISLFYGHASAATDLYTKCGKITPNANPTFQQMNCLLTNAAIKADIPPEVVKAVATQENGTWKQFDKAGKPVISYDLGIGLMQLTNQEGYDKDKLGSDIVYNIEAGVRVLSSKYSRTDLPKIKGAGRQVIENWYFPVLAYNGTKPLNSPLYQETGKRNTKAYQEQVFAKIEEYSYLWDTKLAKYSFSRSDFDYNPDLTESIKFNRLVYTLTSPVHNSAYYFIAGNRVTTPVAGVKLRKAPGTSILKELPKNAALINDGEFTYDSTHQYVWYPVRTKDPKIKGFVSSAYVIKDTVKPVITGATNKTIRLKSSFNPRTSVTAHDKVNGNLTSKITVSGAVNTKKKGTYTLKYTVRDYSKNVTTVTRKITIDSTKPVISGAKNKTIRYKSSFNPRTRVIAKDNLDGSLTSKIKVTGTVNTKKKGSYTLTYAVTDKSRNKTVVKRKITVK